MARFFTEILPDLAEFMNRQKVYFVASAVESGRVNLSPKGMDSFRVLSPTQVGYLDVTGSGAETAAHILAGGRVTIMFCAFEGKPLILRLYGTGQVVRPGDERWDELAEKFSPLPGQRQIILLDVQSLQTSCGMAVPKMDFAQERDELNAWSIKKGEEGLADYRREKNGVSIDGLPTGWA